MGVLDMWSRFPATVSVIDFLLFFTLFFPSLFAPDLVKTTLALATVDLVTGDSFLPTFDMSHLVRFDERIGGFFFVGLAFLVMALLFMQKRLNDHIQSLSFGFGGAFILLECHTGQNLNVKVKKGSRSINKSNTIYKYKLCIFIRFVACCGNDHPSILSSSCQIKNQRDVYVLPERLIPRSNHSVFQTTFGTTCPDTP